MNREEKVNLLKEIRTNPRKMRQEYIESAGLMDFILEEVPYENFKLREKIDVIIHDHKTLCYCGKLSKLNSKFCSLTCRNRCPELRKCVSVKNRENKDVRAKKLKQTLMEKYGVSAVQSIPEVQSRTKEKKQIYYDNVNRETFESRGLDYDLYCDPDYLASLVSEPVSLHTLSAKYFKDMTVTTIIRHYNKIGVDYPKEKSGSSGEKNIYNWIVNDLGLDAISNDRKVIKPKELDVYIPSKNFAIEFDGIYYHKNDKKYHLNKTISCEEKGIQLIHIFEDEWYFKEEIVKSMIKSKLGYSSNKVYARKCSIQQVLGKDAREFLEKTHIQGAINGKHFGLYHEGNLVSIMTVGKCRYYQGYEILRFSSQLDTIVVGAFSKLLKHSKKEMSVDKLYTYADLRYSTGSTYSKFGVFVKQSEPGYYWCRTSTVRRYSRYQTQKHKLKDFLKEKFDPNLTENENMLAAGYEKIYDCGQRLYLV